MSTLPTLSLVIGGDPRARALALLHGIGSNARSFADMMRALGARHRLLAWDAPGYGASDALDGEWPSADAYVDALCRLLDWHGIDDLDVLGHSWGAVIAGRFAARHPARIGRLVLASPALGYGTRPGAPLAVPAAARLDGLMTEGPAQFAAKRGPNLVFRRNDTALVGQVVKAMGEVRLPGYAHASRMLSCADLIADARRIAAPTLVLVGDHDEITPPANCRRLHDVLVAATPALEHRFELIAQAGHAVTQEQPVAAADLVARFLDHAVG